MTEGISRKHMAVVILIGFAILLVKFIYSALFTKDVFVMCDVGQGDGIYLHIGNYDLIVDAGRDSKMTNCLGHYMSPFDKKIELAFITNSDIDHYGGFLKILDHYEVNTVLIPQIADSDSKYQLLLKKFQSKNTRINHFESGDKITMATVASIDSFLPSRSMVSNLSDDCLAQGYKKSLNIKIICTGVNKYSQVFLLNYRKSGSILFTGDITSDVINDYLIDKIITSEIRNNNFILKVPHHGSKNGLTSNLLNIITPKLAVISSGKNNSYGHPHKSITDMLYRKHVRFLTTAREGDIVIDLDFFFSNEQ